MTRADWLVVTPIDYWDAPDRRRKKRLQYGAAQGGDCWHCEGRLIDGPSEELMGEYPLSEQDMHLFPPGFLDNPIHLHHDHVTGLTIGAVHAYCNAVLWVYLGERALDRAADLITIDWSNQMRRERWLTSNP